MVAGILTQGQNDVFSMTKVNKDSERIYSSFGRLGFSVGLTNLSWQNTPNQSILYEVDSSISPSIGLEYNLFQTGQFNFRVGAHVRYHNVVTDIRIDKEDIEFDNDLILESADSPYWNYLLPITAEYNKFIFKDFALSLNAGFEFMYYGVSPEDTIPELSIGQSNLPVVILNEIENPNNITTGINLGAGFYFKAGSLLMRLDTKFHLHMGENVITKRVLATNLQESDNAQSFHAWNGDYVSFNLAIHPQGWFKRKNRSTSSD